VHDLLSPLSTPTPSMESPPTSLPASSRHSDVAGDTAGEVVGSLVALALLALVITFMRRKRNQGIEMKEVRPRPLPLPDRRALYYIYIVGSVLTFSTRSTTCRT
jgi:hypothetical protein